MVMRVLSLWNASIDGAASCMPCVMLTASHLADSLIDLDPPGAPSQTLLLKRYTEVRHNTYKDAQCKML